MVCKFYLAINAGYFLIKSGAQILLLKIFDETFLITEIMTIFYRITHFTKALNKTFDFFENFKKFSNYLTLCDHFKFEK